MKEFNTGGSSSKGFIIVNLITIDGGKVELRTKPLLSTIESILTFKFVVTLYSVGYKANGTRTSFSKPIIYSLLILLFIPVIDIFV